MKKILFCMIALCLCACDSAEKKKPAKDTPIEQTTANEKTKEVPKNNDKYVYIDAERTLHIDKRCVEFLPRMYDRISSEVTTHLHGIKYIPKNDIMPGHFYDYCSQCTEVEDYEMLKNIIKANFAKSIYERLAGYGYDCGDTFEEFYSIIKEDREARRWVYEKYNRTCSSRPANDAQGVEDFANKLDIPCDFYERK